ncbi:CD48 antigen isoform X2 [Paralichthys olivaceus]|uniref:CD48 antigen isoform X2 n=1 Tax=Paralichthys olivaceus TaxID=8255 RepID=UPI00375340FE
MVGGRLRRLSCCLTHSQLLFLVLLLGVCFHDVEASSCDLTVQKQVGDTVEFSTCLSPGDVVASAKWKFNDLLITDKNLVDISKHTKFSGRVELNPRNFSLTVNKLTLQDSGTFKFMSMVNDRQRESVLIHLQVHEPFTPPVLRVNSTWLPSNESCTVSLECVSASDSKVTYNWTVRNQTTSGSRLQFTIRRQDGDTEVTCTIFNHVSERSASETVTCDDNVKKETKKPENLILLVGSVAGSCFIFGLVVVILVCLYKQRPAGNDSDDQTVYAVITDVAGAQECAHSNDQRTSRKCSLYETVAEPANAVKPGVRAKPNTVYDQIQLGRMKEAPVCSHQDRQGMKT